MISLRGLATTLFYVHHLVQTTAITKVSVPEHIGKLYLQGMAGVEGGHINFLAHMRRVAVWLRQPQFCPNDVPALKALQELAS